MNKLILPLIVILIGLNLSSCDPEITIIDPVYTQAIKNDSDQEIKWLFYALKTNVEGTPVLKIDTIFIAPNAKSLGISEGYFFSKPHDGQEESDFVENCISIYNSYPFNNESCKYQLYVGDEVINEAMGPSGYFGDTINSPFNYDSWEVIAYDKVLDVEGVEVVHGELVFTITNDDLNGMNFTCE